MEDSSRYFCNRACEYFPCHKKADADAFNCLFCYCPMHPYEDCPGTPRYIETAGAGSRRIKDCTDCIFPHQPEHYDQIMKFLGSKYTENGS